jgi:hypothetical protein
LAARIVVTTIVIVTSGPTGRRTRRAGPGLIRISQRDIDGLILCAEHYAAPADLLAAALGVPLDRLYAIAARWRRAGYASMGRLGEGPAWYWLTREGMDATGLGYLAAKPPLSRLAHIRAVLAVRLWLQNTPVWQDSQAWWHSERRIRAARDARPRGHKADAEIHWPSLAGRPYAGQVWAIEAELTPKPVERTRQIMTEMLTSSKYSQVLYLTAPAARATVTRAATLLPPEDRIALSIRDLPPTALPPSPAEPHPQLRR